MANVPTATLSAGDSTPKLARASLILATEAINELYSILDPDTDNTKLAIARTVAITGDLSASGNASVTGNLTVTGTITGSISGSAAKWTTARSVGMTGDMTWSIASLDGSANVTAAATLATVNASPGSVGSASNTLTATVNGKGLVTAMSSTPIAISTAQVTSGTFPDARIAQTNVTQYQANLSIAETQIPNGTLLARVADNETISGSWIFTQTLTVNGGNLSITRAAPVINLNQSAAGGGMSFTYSTAGVARWVLGATASTEPGSNVGTDFFIQRRDDSGAVIDAPLQVNRASGLVSIGFLSATNITGTLTGLSSGTANQNFADMSAVHALSFQTYSITTGGLNTPAGLVAGTGFEIRRSPNTNASSVGTYQMYVSNGTDNGFYLRKIVSNITPPNEVWGAWSKIITDQDLLGTVLVGRTNAVLDNTTGIVLAGATGVISAEGSAAAGILELNRTTSDGIIAQFGRQSTAVGSISVTASATTYNTSSDYRLKNILGPVTASGMFIDSLKPVQGTWLADGSLFVGFLAHEFQEVSPSSVTGTKDATDGEGKPVYQTMQASSPEVIANMVAELQSLRLRNATLEEQMAAVMQKLGM